MWGFFFPIDWLNFFKNFSSFFSVRDNSGLYPATITRARLHACFGSSLPLLEKGKAHTPTWAKSKARLAAASKIDMAMLFGRRHDSDMGQTVLLISTGGTRMSDEDNTSVMTHVFGTTSSAAAHTKICPYSVMATGQTKTQIYPRTANSTTISAVDFFTRHYGLCLPDASRWKHAHTNPAPIPRHPQSRCGNDDTFFVHLKSADTSLVSILGMTFGGVTVFFDGSGWPRRSDSSNPVCPERGIRPAYCRSGASRGRHIRNLDLREPRDCVVHISAWVLWNKREIVQRSIG